MPPGTEEAIKAAAGSGYEAVVLVVILLGGMTLLGYIVRYWITKSTEREDKTLQQAVDRETRLAARITDLENFIRDRLLAQLADTTKAMLTINIGMAEHTKVLVEMISTLQTSRPCFWSTEKQDQMICRAADRIVEHVVTVIGEKIHERSKA